jgi:hypothetical protein
MKGSSTYQADDSETDEQHGSPWDHENGVRMKMRFKVLTSGDPATGTARSVYFGFADNRDVIRATVDLGDASRAAGIRLLASEQTDSKAKTIPEEEWLWLVIDTRHLDYVRAKVYSESDGEPPYWDVEVIVPEGAETPTKQDYLEIGLSAGLTGTTDTIYVDSVFACGPADRDCQWVEEKLGDGDGVTQTFTTSMPFKTGSLWFFVDGFHVRTYTIDKDAGTFRANPAYHAAIGAELVARYLYSAETE